MTQGKARVEPASPTAKKRRCLGRECGEMFVSAWAGNRFCPRCTINSKANHSALADDFSLGHRITTGGKR